MDAKIIFRYKNIIIAILIVVAFLAAAQRISSYYTREDAEIAGLERELEDGEITVKRWKRVRKDIDKLSADFLIEETLVFKKFVEERARASGISITSLRTSRSEKDFYWETTMQLAISCTYKNFLVFIKALEEKSVVMGRAVISRPRKEKNIEVNLSLRGFILKK